MYTPGRFAGAIRPRPSRPSVPATARGSRFQNHLPTVRETSAGGVCIRVKQGVPYVAVIIRRNRAGNHEWCLPKGHLEANESPAQAAVREVSEETGVESTVICPISTVNYWFSGGSVRIRKRVHHFLMEYQGGEITALNDPDQEAEDAVWVRLHEAPQILSYANEQRIARVALALLYPDSPQTTKERGNSGSTGDQGPTGGKGSRAR